MNATLRQNLAFAVLLWLPIAARADETETAKLKQTVTVNVADCLRDEIKRLIAMGEKETAEDWSQILQECAALEFEIMDVRKAALDGMGLTYRDSDKPKIRVVMPITKKTIESQKKNSRNRMLSCITAEVGSVEVHKNSKGEITSKTALIVVEWEDLNRKGLRGNPQIQFPEYAFEAFTITIDPNK
jgi:hypothetical protein